MPSVSNLVQLQFTPEQAREIAAQVGWCGLDEAWTYASATTITVPTGAASRFQVGDRLQLTQTTVKYFFVVGVADAVLTVTGGADYTVADAAISAVAYSRVDRPFGFPGYFNHTFTAQTYSSLTYTPVTVYASLFTMQGKWVDLVFNMTGTTSGSDGIYLAINLPLTAHSFIGYNMPVTTTWPTLSQPGQGSIGGATSLITPGASGAANWGLGTGRGVSGHYRYPVDYEIKRQ